MKRLTYNLIKGNIKTNGQSTNPFWFEYDDIETIQMGYIPPSSPFDESPKIPTLEKATYQINGQTKDFIIHVGKDQFESYNGSYTLNGQPITIETNPKRIYQITLKNGKVIKYDSQNNYWKTGENILLSENILLMGYPIYSTQNYLGQTVVLMYKQESKPSLIIDTLEFLKLDLESDSEDGIIESHDLGLTNITQLWS